MRFRCGESWSVGGQSSSCRIPAASKCGAVGQSAGVGSSDYLVMTIDGSNKSLQATAAAPVIFTFDFSHTAVVAGASASPAAVPELGR